VLSDDAVTLGSGFTPFLLPLFTALSDPIAYQGEWTEEGLSEWLLGQDVPVFGELTRGDEKADMYANKFFNSALPKFIAFTEGLDTKQLRSQV